jgi:hypothetical protein
MGKIEEFISENIKAKVLSTVSSKNYYAVGIPATPFVDIKFRKEIARLDENLKSRIDIKDKDGNIVGSISDTIADLYEDISVNMSYTNDGQKRKISDKVQYAPPNHVLDLEVEDFGYKKIKMNLFDSTGDLHSKILRAILAKNLISAQEPDEQNASIAAASNQQTANSDDSNAEDTANENKTDVKDKIPKILKLDLMQVNDDSVPQDNIAIRWGIRDNTAKVFNDPGTFINFIMDEENAKIGIPLEPNFSEDAFSTYISGLNIESSTAGKSLKSIRDRMKLFTITTSMWVAGFISNLNYNYVDDGIEIALEILPVRLARVSGMKLISKNAIISGPPAEMLLFLLYNVNYKLPDKSIVENYSVGYNYIDGVSVNGNPHFGSTLFVGNVSSIRSSANFYLDTSNKTGPGKKKDQFDKIKKLIAKSFYINRRGKELLSRIDVVPDTFQKYKPEPAVVEYEFPYDTSSKSLQTVSIEDLIENISAQVPPLIVMVESKKDEDNTYKQQTYTLATEKHLALSLTHLMDTKAMSINDVSMESVYSNVMYFGKSATDIIKDIDNSKDKEIISKEVRELFLDEDKANYRVSFMSIKFSNKNIIEGTKNIIVGGYYFRAEDKGVIIRRYDRLATQDSIVQELSVEQPPVYGMFNSVLSITRTGSAFSKGKAIEAGTIENGMITEVGSFKDEVKETSDAKTALNDAKEEEDRYKKALKAIEGVENKFLSREYCSNINNDKRIYDITKITILEGKSSNRNELALDEKCIEEANKSTLKFSMEAHLYFFIVKMMSATTDDLIPGGYAPINNSLLKTNKEELKKKILTQTAVIYDIVKSFVTDYLKTKLDLIDKNLYSDLKIDQKFSTSSSDREKIGLYLYEIVFGKGATPIGFNSSDMVITNLDWLRLIGAKNQSPRAKIIQYYSSKGNFKDTVLNDFANVGSALYISMAIKAIGKKILASLTADVNKILTSASSQASNQADAAQQQAQKAEAKFSTSLKKKIDSIQNLVQDRDAQFTSLMPGSNGTYKNDASRMLAEQLDLLSVKGTMTIPGDMYWNYTRLFGPQEEQILLNIYDVNRNINYNSGVFFVGKIVHKISTGGFDTTLEIMKDVMFNDKFDYAYNDIQSKRPFDAKEREEAEKRRVEEANKTSEDFIGDMLAVMEDGYTKYSRRVSIRKTNDVRLSVYLKKLTSAEEDKYLPEDYEFWRT